MFADNLLLHKTIYCVQDYLDLQADTNALAKRLADHKLTLNVKRCKSLLISRKNSFISSLLPISINNSAFDKVQSYSYLVGVTITADLSWSDHINLIYMKARKQLGFIYRKFYGQAMPTTLKTLYTIYYLRKTTS